MNNNKEMNPNKEMKPIVLGNFVIGTLLHDNRLWDRTCSRCKGMYSSLETGVCPKCGAELTYITTTSKGIPMSISEGTIRPALSLERFDLDRKAALSRGASFGVYRFKLYRFPGPDGMVLPPEYHFRCVKNQMVKIVIYNHQPMYLPFPSSDKRTKYVEVMHHIYTNLGDVFQILSAEDIMRLMSANKTPVVTTPAPAQQSKDDEIATLRRRIEALESKGANSVTKDVVPAPAPQPSPNDIEVVNPIEMSEDDIHRLMAEGDTPPWDESDNDNDMAVPEDDPQNFQQSGGVDVKPFG